jgi:hemoglobin-like flavoprotein
MKLVLAIVLLGYAVHTCSADCTPLERFKIKHQWTEAFGHDHRRVLFGLHFWNKFFHEHKESRALFSRVHSDDIYSPDFLAHSMRVLSGLESTISLLDDDEAFTAHLAHLHGQHQERQIPPENFGHFREVLLDLLGEILETRLDWDAWTHCIDHITAGIQ